MDPTTQNLLYSDSLHNNHNKGVTTACYDPEFRSCCSVVGRQASFFDKADQTEKQFILKELRKVLKDKRSWYYKNENGENFYNNPNYKIDDYSVEEIIKNLEETLLEKQRYDEEGHYKSAVCDDCGSVVEKQAVRLHSFSRYSSELSNVQAMISKAKKKLKTILRNVFRVKPFVISFKTHPAYFKSMKKNYEYIINLFFEELRKNKIDFPCVQVIDFKIVVEKRGNIWQVHFHFIAPNLDQDKFNVRVWYPIRDKIAKQTGQYFTVGFDKYKSKKQIIGYFALMMAGRYSLESDHHGASLNEFISPIEYYLNFFGMRSYVIRGHRDQTTFKFNIKYFEWLCSTSCLSKPKICPFCNSTHISLVMPDSVKPPPPQSCRACELETAPQDFSFSTSSCRFCEKSNQKERDDFNKRLDKRLEPTLEHLKKMLKEDLSKPANKDIIINFGGARITPEIVAEWN